MAISKESLQTPPELRQRALQYGITEIGVDPLPAEIAWGPWRPLEDGEIPFPGYTRTPNGIVLVPVRLYGTQRMQGEPSQTQPPASVTIEHSQAVQSMKGAETIITPQGGTIFNGSGQHPEVSQIRHSAWSNPRNEKPRAKKGVLNRRGTGRYSGKLIT